MSKKNSPKKAKVGVENIMIGHKYTNFADKYSKEDLLMALTLVLSSKFISAKDVEKSVNRIVDNEKCLEGAFKLSEMFLKFVTRNFSKTE
ncbi:MAG: hypothetical protein WCT42_02395 [Candidatus Paceibacterota bacterium]|jgi:hypothetical protein